MLLSLGFSMTSAPVLGFGSGWTPRRLDERLLAFGDATPLTAFADTGGTVQPAAGDPLALFTDLSRLGRPASQAIVASRPTLARVPVTGRRNVLERTEELTNHWWARQAITVEDGVGTLNGMPVSRCTTIAGQTWSGFAGNLARDFGSSVGGTVHQFRVRTFGAARYVMIRYSSTDVRNFALDTQTGARQEITAIQSDNTLAHVVQLADGWWEVAVYSNGLDRFFTVALQSALSGNDNAAFVGDGVSGFEISAPSRVLGNFGAEAVTPYQPYQRVGNQYDVTEAGVASPWHARFRLDDWLTHDPIDLDGATIIAGIVELAGTTGTRTLFGTGGSGSIRIAGDPRTLDKEGGGVVDTPGPFPLAERSAVAITISGGTMTVRRATGDVFTNSVAGGATNVFSVIGAATAAGALPANINLSSWLYAKPMTDAEIAQGLAFMNTRMAAT